jgi:periplasmic protein TonB
MNVRHTMVVAGKRLAVLGLLAVVAGAVGLYGEEGRVRVSEADLKKAVITMVKPDFPNMARQLHISGPADMDVFVGEEGDVEKVEPRAGNPMFTGAAAAALKKWKFTPFKADGKPVKAVGAMRINFSQ